MHCRNGSSTLQDDKYWVFEQGSRCGSRTSPIIILNRKSYICMTNKGKDTKLTRHIYRIMHLLRNGKDWNCHNKLFFEGYLNLEGIGTKNSREHLLNPRLGYDMVRLDNINNTCTGRVIGYRRFWRTMCFEWVNRI